MKRTNPFDVIYKQINFLSAEEKMGALPDFPKLLDVELTNTCNFKCLMCPVGTHVQERKPGFMAEDTFARVLAEASATGTPIRFILWGEPTLHKNWLDFMARTKDAGLLVHFNTNGSLLDEEQMQQVVELGIDSVKFSFQGIDTKSYREMRNAEYFETLMAKVSQLHSLRGDRIAPYIHVSTTITYETAEQVKAFREQVEPITDQVTVGRTILSHFDLSKAKLDSAEKSTMEKLKESESLIKKHPNCCPEVYDKLSVHWDGLVSACCADFNNNMIVGDLNENTLAEIWKTPKLQHYREELAKGRFEKFSMCKTCYDYHGLQTPGLQEV